MTPYKYTLFVLTLLSYGSLSASSEPPVIIVDAGTLAAGKPNALITLPTAAFPLQLKTLFETATTTCINGDDGSIVSCENGNYDHIVQPAYETENWFIFHDGTNVTIILNTVREEAEKYFSDRSGTPATVVTGGTPPEAGTSLESYLSGSPSQ